jgi:nucleotide-binding universal stress UspA family protein
VLFVLAAYAGSDVAVNVVGGRAWEADTTIRVLRVVGKFVPPVQELRYDAGGDLDRARGEIKERSDELVERACDWLREQGLNAEAAVRDGEPGPTIVAEAKEWGAGLVVVGSRGHTGLRRLLEGSVSRYVVDHAPCPVEVIHCKGNREEGEDG